MSAFLFLFLSTKAFAANCDFPGTPNWQQRLKLTVLSNALSKPTKIAIAPGISETLFIAEQAGVIRVLVNGKLQAIPALDIRDRVVTLNPSYDERGLLGVAFHPDFQRNRRLFLNYIPKGRLRTRISEFQMPASAIDPASEKVILEFDQPYANHNGGELAFGPDGFLYIGSGDGGSGGDPHGNGQSLSTLLGKILRIDVDHASPYSIPADNPFEGQAGKRGEIYAYGLRNPWRFSFDRTNGELWSADVGQEKWEEIDIIKKGLNYGWNVAEGKHCYADPDCSFEGLEPPVHEYPHSEGVSVVGGFVYRGARFPSLLGTYVFGDWGSGKIWGLRQTSEDGYSSQVLVSSRWNLSTFGEDEHGELYVASVDGKLARLDVESRDGSRFPQTLTETGCFKSLAPLTPAEGFIPFEVNSPLWSDGVDKDRFVRVPRGQKMELGNPWRFPLGTVVLKNFYLPQGDGSRKIRESRFLVKREEGFDGYTYRWNETGQEGQLLAGAFTETVNFVEAGKDVTLNYYYPSSFDCLRCHTKGAGEALGLSTLQLNRMVSVGGRAVPQLKRLKNIGVLDGVPQDLSTLPALSSHHDASLPVEKRARAYLHSQCSHCHNPSTAGPQSLYDMRYETTLANTSLCNALPVHGSLGIPDARVIRPGSPESSILFARSAALTPNVRMPPLATSRVDGLGVEILGGWIKTLRDCR